MIQCDGGKIYLFIAGLLYLRPLIQMKIKSTNNALLKELFERGAVVYNPQKISNVKVSL